jgi:hypothetical protein
VTFWLLGLYDSHYAVNFRDLIGPFLLMKHAESLLSIGRARPACKLLHYSSFDDSAPDEGESYGLSTEIRRLRRESCF